MPRSSKSIWRSHGRRRRAALGGGVARGRVGEGQEPGSCGACAQSPQQASSATRKGAEATPRIVDARFDEEEAAEGPAKFRLKPAKQRGQAQVVGRAGSPGSVLYCRFLSVWRSRARARRTGHRRGDAGHGKKAMGPLPVLDLEHLGHDLRHSRTTRCSA